MPPNDNSLKGYMRDFDLLIKKIAPGEVWTTFEFVVLLNGFIAEVRKTGAKNLIISASHTSPIFEHKIKTWIIQFILPQMQCIGIRRLAFVMQDEISKPHEIIRIPNKNFELGIFTSLSAATAWVMNLSLTYGQTRTCEALSPEYCLQYPH